MRGEVIVAVNVPALVCCPFGSLRNADLFEKRAWAVWFRQLRQHVTHWWCYVTLFEYSGPFCLEITQSDNAVPNGIDQCCPPDPILTLTCSAGTLLCSLLRNNESHAENKNHCHD